MVDLTVRRRLRQPAGEHSARDTADDSQRKGDNVHQPVLGPRAEDEPNRQHHADQADERAMPDEVRREAARRPQHGERRRDDAGGWRNVVADLFA